MSTGSLANDKGKHSRGEKKKKISWKSWKQILVEHWTSHYFSLCLQMLLATVSSAKGQNKGACHRTTQPNPTPPPTSPLPLNRLNVHLLPFFALLLSLRMLHLYHQPPYTTRPLVLLFLLPPPPVPLRLLSLRLPLLLLCPFVSLSLFLCSSLNYWKQNGLKTKTQADVAWLITARRVWHPCQMKTVEKNYYCGRYVTPSPPSPSLFFSQIPHDRFNRFKSAKPHITPIFVDN